MDIILNAKLNAYSKISYPLQDEGYINNELLRLQTEVQQLNTELQSIKNILNIK